MPELHVIPLPPPGMTVIGQHHESKACWCGPLVRNDDPLVIHRLAEQESLDLLAPREASLEMTLPMGDEAVSFWKGEAGDA